MSLERPRAAPQMLEREAGLHSQMSVQEANSAQSDTSPRKGLIEYRPECSCKNSCIGLAQRFSYRYRSSLPGIENEALGVQEVDFSHALALERVKDRKSVV